LRRDEEEVRGLKGSKKESGSRHQICDEEYLELFIHMFTMRKAQVFGGDRVGSWAFVVIEGQTDEKYNYL
jgi:hypothetical protein